MSTQDQIADSDDEGSSSDQIMASSGNQFELANEALAQSMEEEASPKVEVIPDSNAPPSVDTEDEEDKNDAEGSVGSHSLEKDDIDDIDVVRTPSPMPTAERQSVAGSALSHRFRDPIKHSIGNPKKQSKVGDAFLVMVPAPKRPWEYEPFRGDSTVEAVLEEVAGPDGKTLYRIEYADGTTDDVSVIASLEHNVSFPSQLHYKAPDTPILKPTAREQISTNFVNQKQITYNKLSSLRNGSNALGFYHNRDTSDLTAIDSRSTSEREMSLAIGKRPRRQPIHNYYEELDLGSDDDSRPEKVVPKKRRLLQSTLSASSFSNARRSNRVSRQPSRLIVDNEDEEDDDSGSENFPVNGRQNRISRASSRVTRSAGVRTSTRAKASTFSFEDEEDELAGDVQIESDGSDIAYVVPKRKKRQSAGRAANGKRGRLRTSRRSESSDGSPERPTRISGRGNKARKNMREMEMDEELYADDIAEKSAPKIISIREIYQQIPKNSDFGLVHDQDCDICGGTGRNSNKGASDLIYCQGCSSSIHKVCLGYRSNRDHLVTKVGQENFVMQCRRCIGLAVKKDPLAPRLDVCNVCKELGPSCAPFSTKKTSKQEEKLREENDGEDPITEVGEHLINNADNVLFRCRTCQRGYHYDHLPPLSKKSTTPEDLADLRHARHQEYTRKWQCKECSEVSSKIQGLVAWRPANGVSYQTGDEWDTFTEDDKEYLIKWEEKSYFKCTWMPGSWVWGVAAVAMRKAFIRRDEGANMLPKMTEKEAIPEEFLRMEIIFDVEYDRSFRPKSEAHDKAHIDDVDMVLVKFGGLTYEESVWETPPSADDTDRWIDFVAAYNEFIMGKYFKQVPPSLMKERVDAYRSLDFEKKVELKKQPSALIGGEMMAYQMEGLNWLLYNFHQKKNVILADEMGLGKTIQIIALMASLVKDNPKCWPFLVVTPNSTCPNWRREIKKWAPDLRVVAFYGAKSARDMAMKYELYPEGCSDLRAHVVVTSYEAPVDDHSRSFFKKIKWAGMIVDEGQRLKNDQNLLYGALKALKVPFQVLLTGTPLQNNKRELFNLLQFLDSSLNAAKLDEEYAELTKDNLPELHELIRPFFLRRTKVQVLKFLPPMAQVILPVTMSILQKKLYKSILARNPELIKSIFGQSRKTIRATDRGNLNNILMQLRKCLCHPFVYSSAIEETSVSDTQGLRNLIDASSKFQLLEIMLPKLRERGHRVLIFSQFLNQLDIVEDFLNGLGLQFQRLDGTISALEKQKRIDEFNAPNSPLFAFLLSTRAGGVGINLATADTVIIMPHQDMQALSRAHRIGQKKKVLVFQLMTKDSAEEKIVQIGRKKMALDQALIESMDAEDDAGVDLESILKHGAQALFADDDKNDIHYDSASVDKLLDRTQVEVTETNEDKTAESQFSHARVWAQDKGVLSEDLGNADDEPAAPNASVWDAILKQREADAAAEAAKNRQTFGRGKRARHTVDYENTAMELDGIIDTPKKDRRRKRESMSDNEFAAAGDSDAGDTDEDENQMKGTKPKKRVNSFQSTKRPSQSPKTPGGKDVRLTLTSAPPSKLPQQQGLRGRASRTVQKQERSGKKTSLPVRPVRGNATPGKSIQEPNNTQKTRRVPAPKQKPANVPASKSAKQQGSTNAPGKKLLKAAPKASESENSNLQDAKSSKGDTLASIATQPVTRASSSGSHSAGAEHSPLFPSAASDKEHGASTSPLLSALTQDSMTHDTATSESANKQPSFSPPDDQPKPKKRRRRPKNDYKPANQGSGIYTPSNDSPFPVAHQGHGIHTPSNLSPFHVASQFNHSPGVERLAEPQPNFSAHTPIVPSQNLNNSRPAPPTTARQPRCPQCSNIHILSGPCKAEFMEYCNLCGIAHFGSQPPTCPHLNSNVQIRLMLDALRTSDEDPDHVAAAVQLLRKELAQRAERRSMGGGGNTAFGHGHRSG
ncbi:hypothetical protein CJF31_00003499 [Rutstroemia sp. NJR-2017a BVV2]|nr:hypothetical protein CJF31_00003499 [Rutstroemia sp. NJR-2017a BVV2]